MQLQATILLMMSVIMPNMLMADQDSYVPSDYHDGSDSEWDYFMDWPAFNVGSVPDLTPAQRKFADTYLGAAFHFNFDGPWGADEGTIPGMTPFVVEGKTYPGQNLAEYFIADNSSAQYFNGMHISMYYDDNGLHDDVREQLSKNKNLWEARSDRDFNDFADTGNSLRDKCTIRIRVNDSADGIDVMFTKGDSRDMGKTSYRSRVNEYRNTERGSTAVGSGFGQEAEWIPMQNWNSNGYWSVDGDKTNGVCSVLHLGNNTYFQRGMKAWHDSYDSFHNIFGTYLFSIDHIISY